MIGSWILQTSPMKVDADVLVVHLAAGARTVHCPAPAPVTPAPVTPSPAPATLVADADPVLALLGVAALASTLPGAGPLTQATSEKFVKKKSYGCKVVIL